MCFRGIFFVMTFFSIGVMSNFRKLWEEGIGKLAAVYVLCLFGYIIWIGLAISWIFFHGMTPPLNEGVRYGKSNSGTKLSSRASPKKSRRWSTNRWTASKRS